MQICSLCAVSSVQEQLQTNDIQSFLAALIPDGIMTSLLRFPTSTSLSSILSFSAIPFFCWFILVCHQASLAPSEEEQMGDYDNLGLSATPLSGSQRPLTDCHPPVCVLHFTSQALHQEYVSCNCPSCQQGAVVKCGGFYASLEAQVYGRSK